MPTALEQYDLARGNDDFRKRILILQSKVASNLAAARSTGESFERRHALAVAVLNHPEEHLDRFCIAVAGQMTVTAASSDGDLEWAIGSVFGHMAGVRTDT